jgi:hypothetical protein
MPAKELDISTFGHSVKNNSTYKACQTHYDLEHWFSVSFASQQKHTMITQLGGQYYSAMQVPLLTPSN